jgi:hypothetical protein
MWWLRRWQRKCGFSAGSWQIQKTTKIKLFMWELLGDPDATFCSLWVQRMVSLITHRHDTFSDRLTLWHRVFVGYQKKLISHLHCCILHGPSGERILDVVPWGMEFKPQDNGEFGHAAHTCSNPHIKCMIIQLYSNTAGHRSERLCRLKLQYKAATVHKLPHMWHVR